MATEARPPFLPITGEFADESGAAAQRFAAAVRAVDGASEDDPCCEPIAQLATRAFAGDGVAWRPLVIAVRDFLMRPVEPAAGAARARRELRAFVAENADLLDD